MTHVRANGIDIAYESFGRDGDPAILMIKGLNTPLTGWPDSLCHGLAARGFRVIRFDNRDVGLTTHLSELGAPDIAAMMAKVEAGEPVVAPYALDDMASDAAAAPRRARDRVRPYRRLLDGRHDRAARRAQPSRKDPEPRLDHVLVRAPAASPRPGPRRCRR